MNKEFDHDGRDMIGLTGNMGCGKSVVGEMLKTRERVTLFDCDKIIRDLFTSSDYIKSVEKVLGTKIVKNGVVDKSLIANIIFNNKEKKGALEDFNEPLVFQKINEEVEKLPENAIVIVEMAVLYEKKWNELFEKVIVATCDNKEQLRRIKARNGWTDKQITERLANQWPSEYKESRALIVVDTHCSLPELNKKTVRVYQHIVNKERGKLVL